MLSITQYLRNTSKFFLTDLRQFYSQILAIRKNAELISKE